MRLNEENDRRTVKYVICAKLKKQQEQIWINNVIIYELGLTWKYLKKSNLTLGQVLSDYSTNIVNSIILMF